jgi:hypothetical protein
MIGLEVKEARVFVRPGATDRDCCTTDSPVWTIGWWTLLDLV